MHLRRPAGAPEDSPDLEIVDASTPLQALLDEARTKLAETGRPQLALVKGTPTPGDASRLARADREASRIVVAPDAVREFDIAHELVRLLLDLPEYMERPGLDGVDVDYIRALRRLEGACIDLHVDYEVALRGFSFGRDFTRHLLESFKVRLPTAEAGANRRARTDLATDALRLHALARYGGESGMLSQPILESYKLAMEQFRGNWPHTYSAFYALWQYMQQAEFLPPASFSGDILDNVVIFMVYPGSVLEALGCAAPEAVRQTIAENQAGNTLTPD
ncbi:MAG: hypothetical protein HY684_00200 [Chloroflexi bacterium]|nr:hypothetical protein [Chloroflexota bacterium]